MPGKDFGYNVIIDRGYTATNDAIIDWLIRHIVGTYLDVGCNGGWLLSEVPGGVGIDATEAMVVVARHRGHEAHHGWAEELPFRTRSFDTVVLSSVLSQCEDPDKAIAEALRVARKRVIGINPLPGKKWGEIRGWTHAVIPPGRMEAEGAVTGQFDENHYWFIVEQECRSQSPTISCAGCAGRSGRGPHGNATGTRS